MIIRLFGVFLAVSALSAWPQAYPNRAVRIVVPAATGGPDIVARVVAAQLQAQLGQPFVVENRPGANGIVGADAVAKSPPDGYTLMVYSTGLLINPFVHKKLPYDTEKDFVPVTNLVSNLGLFFAVHPSVPAQSLRDFIALARKPDARLAYSSPGIGNPWHLAMEGFNNAAGTKIVHIPYKGGGPATAALAAHAALQERPRARPRVHRRQAPSFGAGDSDHGRGRPAAVHARRRLVRHVRAGQYAGGGAR
jgi:tripartite-type tricarboxylate transporter receptor subunit TctC